MSEIVTLTGEVTSRSDGAAIDEAMIARLLAKVGARVRDARTRKGISRRELSEKSGVSQRYLAQLEAGLGNISIALLLRIAGALDFEIHWLLAEDDPWDSETAAISRLLRSATAEQRAAIFGILERHHGDEAKAQRIALIGLRGAGKSTLGRLCADQLGLAFLELNEMIGEAGGMPVEEVIALYGQEGYRHLERQSLERTVATHDAVILAVAGGIVSQPDTFDYLLRNFHTIWLSAEPEEHMARVRGQGDERPMAGNPDAMQELRRILKSRASQYARASSQVDTSKASVEESLKAVLREIRRGGFAS